MNPVEHTPLLLNWSFWAVIIATIALILSQLSPIRILFRPTRLQVEPYDRLLVSHWLGNPNVNLHLLLTNTGGRNINVLSMELNLRLEDGSTFRLPAQTFSPPGEGKGSFLFTRFTLKQGEEWGNFISFYSFFDTADERLSKQLAKDVRKNISQKIQMKQQTEPNYKGLLEAEPSLVQPIKDFFEKHNKWRSGEYSAELQVNCEPNKATVVRHFRFTLYESDVIDLNETVSNYKYGAGIYFPDQEATAVNPRIRDLI